MSSPTTSHGPGAVRLAAVLFDRDGTLVDDVPYNGDPDRARLRPGVADGVARLRARGLRLALVTNQSGVGRGLISERDARAVNRRVAALVGGLDAMAMCVHAPGAGCACRKPGPLLVRRAAASLGVATGRCAVVGDRATDVEAAEAAGAWGLLVDHGDGAFARAVDLLLERA